MTWEATRTDPLVSLDQIRAAHAALPAVVRRTPVLPVARCPAEVGRESLFVKAECLQVTGAYKVRAAFTVLASLTPPERERGVVLASSGNFAQGFAYAGACLGVPIVVVMLDRSSAYKVDATRGYGAEVVLCGDDPQARQPTVAAIARQRGLVEIDTWESATIIAGHGSVGVEIVEDCPELARVLVPVSSGGLAAGVATAVKELRPDVSVVGVQPEGANAAYLSMRRGEPVTIEHWETIADGLSSVRPGEIPLRHLMEYLDEIVLVSEREIGEAFRTLLMRTKIVGEPAGVVAAAAFLSGKVDDGAATVALMSGGNLTHDALLHLVAEGTTNPEADQCDR